MGRIVAMVVGVVLLLLPAALALTWMESAEARLVESERTAPAEAPKVAVAQEANQAYCTPELKQILRRVLTSCGLISGDGARGCEPLEAKNVATMAGADLLVLLSDVDGLYDAPPGSKADAKHVPVVERITGEVEAMAGAAGSELSRGGMQTKIEAGKIATQAGTHMVIASGRIAHPLQAITEGGRATWFLTGANPVTARKKWIAGSLEPKGILTIDAGAVAALRTGRRLLPAGVIRVDGAFARGDAVIIRGPDGAEVGRGLVAYDATDAEKIKGRSSADIPSILGFSGRTEMVHRDHLVVGRG